MYIKLGTMEMLPILNRLLVEAKQEMLRLNNPQWTNNYPNVDVLAHDIEQQNLYVVYEGEICIGYFTLDTWCSTEYQAINWKTTAGLYLYRIVLSQDYLGNGITYTILEFAKKQTQELGYPSLRSTTFHRNIPMQYIFLKAHFEQMDLFYMNDRKELGSFLAYEYII